MRSTYLHKFLYSTFIVLLFALQQGYGQVKSTSPTPLVIKGIAAWDFASKTLGEDYTIYVQLPPGYDTTKTSYPVLYMTDADWNMTVAMNCFSMLRQDYKIIQPIIVGIGYGSRENKRFRDLNPKEGANSFLSFIEKEVMPFVQSQYRANDSKALYGYSLGGMFATAALFEHPGLFDMVFIGAPGGEIMPYATTYFETNKTLKCKVFLGVGSKEPNVVKNIKLLSRFLQNQKRSGLEVSTAITPNAGHGAALAQVMQNAIAFGYVTGDL